MKRFYIAKSRRCETWSARPEPSAGASPTRAVGGAGGAFRLAPEKALLRPFAALGKRTWPPPPDSKPRCPPPGGHTRHIWEYPARVCGYGVAYRISSELSGKSCRLMPPSLGPPLAAAENRRRETWSARPEPSAGASPTRAVGGAGGAFRLAPEKALLRPFAALGKRTWPPAPRFKAALSPAGRTHTQHIWEYPARRHHSRRTAPIHCSREKQSRKACR